MQGRIEDPGMPVVTLRLNGATMTCACGHGWSVDRRTILNDPAAAELCARCGAMADSVVPHIAVEESRRGVRIRMRAHES